MKIITSLFLLTMILNSTGRLIAQVPIKQEPAIKNIPVAVINNTVPILHSSNNSITDDKCCYRNVATFFAISKVDVQKWNVPAGVTSITVEAWGAGGAGGTHSGGGGGGYIQANFPVTSGTTVNITIGAGGRGEGEITTVSVNSTTVYAGGGGKANESFEEGYPIPGGGFFGVVLSSTLFRNFTGEVGESGNPSTVSYMQYTTTDFRQITNVGSGGDAGNSKNTGATGGQIVSRIPGGGLFDASRPSPARIPGGGGAAQSTSEGAAGMVVIHY